MRHFASSKFWRCFNSLPAEVQSQARRQFNLLKQSPEHPSLKLKSISGARFRSVRVGLGYRALGVPVPEGVQWFWIGTHAEYDRLIG